MKRELTKEEKEAQEHQESLNRRDLREMSHWYGGWDELRKVIEELEENDKEAAWERHNSRY
jgi:rhamnogalacturonyl hydrolase YesR